MIIGKRKLCYTETSDFTEVQGVGNDPIYKRYGSVDSVVQQFIAPEHRDFLAQPEYSVADDWVIWYVKAWSNDSYPVKLTEQEGTTLEQGRRLLQQTVDHYRQVASTLKPEDQRILHAAIKFINEDFVYIIDGKPVLAIWGMRPDDNRRISSGVLIHDIDYNQTFPVTFDAGEHGRLQVPQMAGPNNFPSGKLFRPEELPAAIADEGYEFSGWTPDPLATPLRSRQVYTAKYNKKETPPPIPAPVEEKIEQPTPPPPPAAKRPWLKSCLGGSLIYLLLLAAMMLLLSLIKSCDSPGRAATSHNTHIYDHGDTHNGSSLVVDNGQYAHVPGYGSISPTVPSTPIDPGDLGDGVDPGNGDGDYHSGVFPIDPGMMPIPNPDDPNGPDIIPNMLSVFFADDNANLNAFAKDFREIYPDRSRYLLDYDDAVKMVQIKMPSEERQAVKDAINTQLGQKYDFVVVDEVALYNEPHYASLSSNEKGADGWHLQAIGAPEAWKTTKGSEDVTIAVVDDGCQLDHEMFKGKITNPYNVYTKNGQLTPGSGHGTHTAGLAAGLTMADHNASGIAPGCKLMPVQVFQDGIPGCTTSAQISGIMYALHHGADVVSISIGPDYSRYGRYSEQEQEQIADTRAKGEEMLWNRIFKIADEKNAVLVFAAGNENVVSYLCPNNRPDSIVTVTAIDSKLNKADFSNYGKGSTVTAPGVNIVSALPGGKYGPMDGTSMATPIVAGAIGLLKSVDKNITAGQAIDILQKSGIPVSDSRMGPLLRVDRAVALASNTPASQKLGKPAPISAKHKRDE